MKTTLLPGAAPKLRALGIHHKYIGRIVNKAAVDISDITVPSNATELEEMLHDDSRLKAILGDRDKLGAVMNAYAAKTQAPGTDLHQQVQIETQRALAQMLKDRDVTGEGRDAIQRMNLDPQTRPTSMLTSHKQATAYNPKAVGTLLDKEFNSAVEYFAHAWHRNPKPEAQAKMQRLMNAASSVVPADGGFLVPETLRSQLLQLALEMGVVRSRATVVPMETARVPFPMIDATTNQTSVFGGMIAYWGEESAALTDASPKFGRVILDAKKLTGLSVVPNELLADSLISFAALIEKLWPQALAWYEDVAFITGTGAGEPLGFLGASNPASIGVSAASGQAADTIVYENIISMYSRMLPSSLNRGIWLCSPEAIPELFSLALTVGTGGGPVMITNVAGAPAMSILGRPLIVSEKMSRLGDRGDLAFVDLSYYLVGDRQIMTAASSTDWKFGNDQTAFRLIQRVDGRPWLQSAITPQNGGPTLSPFVEIAAR